LDVYPTLPPGSQSLEEVHLLEKLSSEMK
jgi:hypothetical protein